MPGSIAPARAPKSQHQLIGCQQERWHLSRAAHHVGNVAVSGPELECNEKSSQKGNEAASHGLHDVGQLPPNLVSSDLILLGKRLHSK